MTERAVFDVRVWVEADTRGEVFALIAEVVERARSVAPAGADVKYSQLRRTFRNSAFAPTIQPRKRKRAA